MAHILVVDDSELVRIHLNNILRDKGYIVTEAYDAMDAINKFISSKAINLIITDMRMPGVDGIEMCEMLQAKNARPVPIIILSTECSVELKKRAKSAGVSAWCYKPYNADKLLHAVDVLLTKSLLP